MLKPLAYSYIRMSTDLQLKGDSLRRQVELSEKYAKANDLELVRDFTLHDIGVSAFKGANVANGALGRFLEAIDSGEVPKGSYLLVESLDRLSRQDVSVSVTLFLQITQSGVNIVTLADNNVYRAGKTEFAQLIYSIVVMARANEESAMKSSRVAAAWKNKRRQIGQRVLTKTCPGWLSPSSDRTCFEAIPERVKIVRRIFDAAANGQGSGVITRILNNDHVPAFGKSNGWLESYVTKILKNRAVLGEFQPHIRIEGKRVPDGPVVKDYFPKIIDENLFLKVQSGRRERTLAGGGRRGPKQRNLFTHIVKCDYCGSSMRFIDKGTGPKGGRYLKCGASVRGLDCVSISWRYNDFESSVFSFVREFDLRAIVEDSHLRTKTSTVREELMIQRERLENSEAERDRIYDLLIGVSDETDEYLKTRLDGLSQDIAVSKSAIDGLEDKLNNLPNKSMETPDVEGQLSALTKLTEKADFQSRLLVSTKLRELILRINVATDGAQPRFNETKRLVEENVDDEEYRDRLISALKESHFSGPRSNPYFTVFFHNGSSRVVIPEIGNPTSLQMQIDVGDEGVRLKGASGQSDDLFSAGRLELDSLGIDEE